MTELLWILTCLPLVLTAVSELPAPSDVMVTLDGSGYILRWEPGGGTAAGTSFGVDTKRSALSRRHSWIPVPGCQQVQTPLICNLTEAFEELTDPYDIQVKARLENRTSQPAVLNVYKPIEHLPLPRLNATLCHPNICVAFLPPLKHLRESYDRITYQLRIKSPSHDEAKVLTFHSLSSRNVTDLVPGRDYCFSIRFFDDLLELKSDFSQPYCISTPGNASSDAVVSAVLSVLLVAIIVVLVLLFRTGFICLKGIPMPSILTSIHHLEVSTRSSSLPSLLNLWLMAPPVGKGSHSSSEETDEEESYTETSARNSLGANYTVRPGGNLLSSSSSSSSTSLSSSSKPELPPSSCCNQTADGSPLQPKEALVVLENEQNPQRPDSSIGARSEEEEKLMNVGEMVGQEVNLLTLTFGLPEEEEEDCRDVSEVFSALAPPLVQPSHPAAAGASPCAADEEEEDAYDCEYMCRHPAAV